MNDFSLVSFLKENLKHKDFKIGYDNCFIYCNFDRGVSKFKYHWSFENKDLIVGTPYFTFNNLDYVTEVLTNEQIDPNDLQIAFKKLNWL